MTRPRPAWTPPLRDGVSASRVAVTAGRWRDLADFLAVRLPAGGDWRGRLARGEVLDAAGLPFAPDAAAVAGALVWYWRKPPPEPRVPFDIEVLHQDDHLVVVDKPHFLAVTPGGRHLQETVLVRLRRALGTDTLVPIHRLDLETAGVLLFSARPDSRHAYQSLFRDRQVEKVYEAIAPWRANLLLPQTVHHRIGERPGAAFMQMVVLPGEPNAQTRIELIARLPQCTAGAGPGDTAGAWASEACPDGGDLAHYRLLPHTGRKHQLRLQLCAVGLPILWDRIYPILLPPLAEGEVPDYSRPLQLLARSVRFMDPVSGQERCFVSARELRALGMGVSCQEDSQGFAAGRSAPVQR